MAKSFKLLALVAVLALASMGVAQAGTTKATTLNGVVEDPTGALIPGATVVVRDRNVEMLHANTDNRGTFSFDGTPGAYDVVVSASGFKTLTSTSMPFASGAVAEFRLNVGNDVVCGPCIVMPIELTTTDASVAHMVEAQPVAASNVRRMNWEFGVFVQGGVGLQDRSDFGFFMVGGHAGKVLTPELGSGVLKGNFEYGVEVFPFWQSYTPKFQKIICPAGATLAAQCSKPYTSGGTYTGASITPILLRWNFTHGEKLMPWVQGAGGVVCTTRKYPGIGNLNPLDPTMTGPSADTSVWNFTPQFGVGAHYFVAPQRSIDVGANAVHISSASLGDKNPGVNASVQFSVGYTLVEVARQSLERRE